MELNKKIVLITTGQPSINPRIVKEADALADAGYDVTVLYCFWIYWALEADKKILANAKWKYKLVGGTPTERRRVYFITRLCFKLFNYINKYIGNKCGIAEKAQARCFKQLLQAAKNNKADWYIGHNLGALAIAVKAARYNNAKAGFDFEDYHRAEHALMNKADINRIMYLENKYVPALRYISTASPLITERIKSNYTLFQNPIITLLNTFPLSQQPAYREKTLSDCTLQLFWFSQTVGTNRGLEMVIDVVKEIANDNIHLSLAGRCSEEIKRSFKQPPGDMSKNIHFVGIVQPNELPSFSAQFDIGLALEPAFSINNDIALSNKLFTYLLAGNALLLSETSGQKLFVEQYNVGLSFPINNKIKLKTILESFLDKKLLCDQKMDSWQLANKVLNWENESKKLLRIIN